MGLVKPTDLGLDKIANISNNVEVFNGVSLDKSKNLFKGCLGTEFPFDVIESVEKYAQSLANALNSGLDDILCGNAVPNLISDTTNTGSNIASSFGFGEGETEDENEDDAKIDYKVTNYSWLKRYSMSGLDKIEEAFNGYDGAGAAAVLVQADFDYDINSRNASVNLLVNVDNLFRGPNDGLSESTDGKNKLPPVSGSFSFNKKIKADIGSSNVQFSAEDIKLSTENITIKVSAIVYGLDSNTCKCDIVISEIFFNKNWSMISSEPNTLQKNHATKIQKQTTNDVKNKALNALKSEFMQSSEIDGAMDRQLDKMIDGCPALAGINKGNIKNSVKNAIADNAISIANGGPITLEKTVISTVAGEVSASAINSGLSELGIDANISSDCTKKLLEDVMAATGFEGLTLANPFEKLMNYINFDDAYNYAKGLMDELNSRFNKLLSSECVQALNNTFDVCSNSMANVTGYSLDFVGAESRGNLASKKFIDSVTG